MRQRGQSVELSFAPVNDTGGMRRTHLRGHENILKRLLVHAGAFNLGLVMRKAFGRGTPRGLQGWPFDAGHPPAAPPPQFAMHDALYKFSRMEATTLHRTRASCSCLHRAAKSVIGAAHFRRLAAARGLSFEAVAAGTEPDPTLAPEAVKGRRDAAATPDSRGVPAAWAGGLTGPA